MTNPTSESNLPSDTPIKPRRPKESWYHFVVPFFAALIVLVFVVFLRFAEVPEPVRNLFVALTFPLLIGGAWWVIFRADLYSDEFQIAISRQVESIGFRFLVFWILAGEFVEVAGLEWDYFDVIRGIIYAGILGSFLTHRRVYGRFFPFASNKKGGGV